MYIKEIINYQAVSRLLANNDESIRKNKCPKKYERKVKRLILLVTLWSAWAKEKKGVDDADG